MCEKYKNDKIYIWKYNYFYIFYILYILYCFFVNSVVSIYLPLIDSLSIIH